MRVRVEHESCGAALRTSRSPSAEALRCSSHRQALLARSRFTAGSKMPCASARSRIALARRCIALARWPEGAATTRHVRHMRHMRHTRGRCVYSARTMAPPTGIALRLGYVQHAGGWYA